MKKYIHIAAFAAILMAVSACIYPFEPELDARDSRLVVDGDIHIGDISTFNFSRVYPLDVKDYTPPPIRITGYIEGEDGSRLDQGFRPPEYDPIDIGFYEWATNFLSFDTTDLPTGQRYRLHFEDLESGEIYESDWLEV